MKASLLGLPVGQAAARYLLHLCNQADEACARLQDPNDTEALHDFRVAIRRSRAWIRAYHLYLPVDKPLRKYIRDLATRTNGARDAEVSIAELQVFAGQLTVAQKSGLDWILARFEEARCEAYSDILHHVPRTWPALAKALRHDLHKKAGKTVLNFSPVSYELASSYEVELAHGLESIGSLKDNEAIHRARIAAKRLRYLLEPFKADVKGMKEAVNALAVLQDAMGGLHDGHILEQKLAVAVEEAAIQRARKQLERVLENPDASLRIVRSGHDEQKGLLALTRLVALQQHQRFADMQAQYLARHARPFMDQIESAIGRLVVGR